MEFNQLINRYLVRDPESRKRNLHIRTYAVIPLNEECGLIEWIPNLIGLRHILNKIYKEKGIITSNTELKRMMPQLRDTLARKKEIFLKGSFRCTSFVFCLINRAIISTPTVIFCLYFGFKHKICTIFCF